MAHILKPLADFNFDDSDQFAKINPIYNVWAYWREFVQNMTTRMNLPVLTMPLLKITPQKPVQAKANQRNIKGNAMPRKKTNA